MRGFSDDCGLKKSLTTYLREVHESLLPTRNALRVNELAQIHAPPFKLPLAQGLGDEVANGADSEC